MTRLLMNAIDDYNAGKVAPDTIGADKEDIKVIQVQI